MIIEFVGLPGSGKSTLKKILLSDTLTFDHRYLSTEEAYYDTVRQCGDKLTRLCLKSLPRKQGIRLAQFWMGRSLFQTHCTNEFLARHGRSLEAFLASSLYEKMSVTDRQRVVGNLLDTGSLWSMLQHRHLQDGVRFVFEEGFIQKSLMFVDVKHGLLDDEKSLARYFESIPKPESIIYLRTPVELSYSRMCARPDGLTNRLQHASQDEIFKFLEFTRTHLDNSIRRMQQYGCRVIDIDNQGSLDELTENLRLALAKNQLTE